MRANCLMQRLSAGTLVAFNRRTGWETALVLSQDLGQYVESEPLITFLRSSADDNDNIRTERYPIRDLLFYESTDRFKILNAPSDSLMASKSCNT
jgi:hypothetical protein